LSFYLIVLCCGQKNNNIIIKILHTFAWFQYSIFCISSQRSCNKILWFSLFIFQILYIVKVQRTNAFNYCLRNVRYKWLLLQKTYLHNKKTKWNALWDHNARYRTPKNKRRMVNSNKKYVQRKNSLKNKNEECEKCTT
jgi:hypothetical protein